MVRMKRKVASGLRNVSLVSVRSECHFCGDTDDNNTCACRHPKFNVHPLVLCRIALSVWLSRARGRVSMVESESVTAPAYGLHFLVRAETISACPLYYAPGARVFHHHICTHACCRLLHFRVLRPFTGMTAALDRRLW